MARLCSKCRFSNADDAENCIKCGYDLSALAAMDRDTTIHSNDQQHQNPPASNGGVIEQLDATNTIPSATQKGEDLFIGRTLSGRYRLEANIGRGGAGTVFRAEDTRSRSADRFHAVKIMETGISQDEIEAIRELEHRNIIRIDGFDIDDETGRYYLVMEHIAGGVSLKNYPPDRRIAIEEFRNFAGQICDGVIEIHRNEFIHGDLKPSNILRKQEQNGITLKIADFGLARRVDRTDEITGAGTPLYMAPEQQEKENPKPGNVFTDQYALGVTFYELLSGNLPFDHSADKFFQKPKKIKGVPRRINKAIAKSLELDPRKRHDSIAEFREALVKPGGFWKGFFKTLLVLVLLAGVSYGGLLAYREYRRSRDNDRRGEIRQIKAILEPLIRAGDWPRVSAWVDSLRLRSYEDADEYIRRVRGIQHDTDSIAINSAVMNGEWDTASELINSSQYVSDDEKDAFRARVRNRRETAGKIERFTHAADSLLELERCAQAAVYADSIRHLDPDAIRDLDSRITACRDDSARQPSGRQWDMNNLSGFELSSLRDVQSIHGRMRMSCTTGNAIAQAILQDVDFSDGDISVEVDWVQGENNSAFGLQFRSSYGVGLRCYRFVMNRNGYHNFAEIVDNRTTWYLNSWVRSDATVRGGSNTLEVHCDGPEITFHINGSQVGQIANARLDRGFVSLYTNKGLTVDFDNLIVTPR